MYLIIDKETQDILADNPAPMLAELTASDVYPRYNPTTMLFVRSDLPLGEVVARYASLKGWYTIDESGILIEKTLAERVAAGVVAFDELFFAHAQREKAWTSKERTWRTVELALDLSLIKTANDCELATLRLDEDLEARIAQEYRPSLELKLFKDYVAWQIEGSPEGDARKSNYDRMQAYIRTIKAEYKPARARLSAILAALPPVAAPAS